MPSSSKQQRQQPNASSNNVRKKLKSDDEFIDELWGHYRDFLDSMIASDNNDGGTDGSQCEGGSGGGEDADYDSLHEILSLTEHIIPVPSSILTEKESEDDEEGNDNNKEEDKDGRQVPFLSRTMIQERVDLLPVLLSVVYYHLADAAIGDYLSLLPEMKPHQMRDDQARIQKLITNSLAYFPSNAATWSIGANFGRITQSLNPKHVRMWYEQAVVTATRVRREALNLLEEDDNDDEDEEKGVKDNHGDVEDKDCPETQVDGDVKEMVELLLLNQVCGVEYEMCGQEKPENDEGMSKKEKPTSNGPNDKRNLPDEFENEDESRLENESSQNKGEEGEESSEEDGYDDNGGGSVDDDCSMEGQYSSSAVESMSRFMCAMLFSVESKHDEALKHLKKFPLTHRIHPNVWTENEASSLAVVPTAAPVVFRPTDGILPPNLFSAMKKVFAPKSAYWTESDYSNRGYYSYFLDYNKDQKQPTNLVEDVIVNYLLPRAQQVLDLPGRSNSYDASKEQICGFEWWTHTRPIRANLGHNLHFDTDESMLEQEGAVTHPVLSSVLYLTGGSANAGATIVFDETPDSKEVASKCWKGIPQDNSFLIFPGDSLHGVLPCPGETSNKLSAADHQNTSESRLTTNSLVYDCWKTDDVDKDEIEVPNRLTFMVGFWTRNVPATMKKRQLYGPCGPLPPKGTKWVDEINEGYKSSHVQSTQQHQNAAASMTALPLPCISPAWERFDSDVTTDDGDEPTLKIPPSIDHRFFVRNAPNCFRESLFE